MEPRFSQQAKEQITQLVTAAHGDGAVNSGKPLPWAYLHATADAIAATVGDQAPTVRQVRAVADKYERVAAALDAAATALIESSRGRLTSDEQQDAGYAARTILRSLGAEL